MLADLGWNPFFESGARWLDDRHFVARVGAVHRGALVLLVPGGEHEARVAGRLQHAAVSALDLPAAGDWVVARRDSAGTLALVVRVLPRMSRLVRQAAGDATEPQVIAANVDLVVLVSALDQDFNPRRLERYAALVEESGALPLVLLNKADLCDDPAPVAEAAAEAVPGARVIVASARDGRGLADLRNCIRPGVTAVLLGSSGVGKSTTLNALLGREVQHTLEVRAHDHRGRHATTHRELFPLPGGGLLLDTPGMRELAAWVQGDEAPAGFDDVDELVGSCRFSDCTHASEPGCAVREAIADGRLDEGRLANWRKLERERAWQASRQDVHLRQQIQGRWKAIHKSVRAAQKHGWSKNQ